MRLSRLISLLGFTGILFYSMIGTTGCANIIPPGGGPVDSLPPRLVRATPGDSTLNFRGNRISFVFDEYVDLDNYQQNMIVSPLTKNTPTVSRKLQNVLVRISDNDTLEPNTTYTINFGKTIKDINEGNILKDFTYTFSTGNYIDSLRFSGNIVLAETGDVDTTLTVMLHTTNDDSAVVKERPRYITRTDSRGHFTFKNLPPAVYYVYALKDEGNIFRYSGTDRLFAFADSAVIVSQTTPPVTLYAYAVKKEEKPATETTQPARNRPAADKRLKFTTNLIGERQDLLSPFFFEFATPIQTFDSTRVRFLSDTSFLPVTGHRWEMDSTSKKLTLFHTWKENTLYHLVLDKDFATDTLGQQLLKADTISFSTKRISEYAKLTLRFRNLDLTKNPVLLFVQNNQVFNSYPLTATTFTRAMFPPGDYDLRILEDRNKNGKWDPGKFFGERLQPELVKPLQRKLTVKANTDNPIEVDASAVVIPGAAGPAQNTAAPARNNSPGSLF